MAVQQMIASVKHGPPSRTAKKREWKPNTRILAMVWHHAVSQASKR
jgi:hypothetical protein